MRSVLESNEFTLDRYRSQADRNNAPDKLETILWTMIAIFTLIMFVARMDSMIERRLQKKTVSTVTYETTMNNPGRVKPIPNYSAGVND